MHNIRNQCDCLIAFRRWSPYHTCGCDCWALESLFVELGGLHAEESVSQLMGEWHGMLQAAAREARANQIKLDAQQLESLLFQLFERKV